MSLAPNNIPSCVAENILGGYIIVSVKNLYLMLFRKGHFRASVKNGKFGFN